MLHMSASNVYVRWPDDVERFTSHTTEHRESHTVQKEKDINNFLFSNELLCFIQHGVYILN